MRLRFVLVLVLALAGLTGCGRTIFHSYAMPSRYDYRYAKASSCVDRCRGMRNHGEEFRLLCIERCPGILKATGAYCAPWAVACAKRYQVSGADVARGFGVALLAAAGAAVAVGESKAGQPSYTDDSLSSLIMDGAVAVGRSGQGVPPPPLDPPQSPPETRCAPPRPPAPQGICKRRLSNLHYDTEEQCSYFCLDHCRWHAPGSASPGRGSSPTQPSATPAAPPPVH